MYIHTVTYILIRGHIFHFFFKVLVEIFFTPCCTYDTAGTGSEFLDTKIRKTRRNLHQNRKYFNLLVSGPCRLELRKKKQVENFVGMSQYSLQYDTARRLTLRSAQYDSAGRLTLGSDWLCAVIDSAQYDTARKFYIFE